MTAAIELHDVGLVRDRTPILRGVDWHVGAGERWAVLGPNGAGKTSLLRVCSSYLMPTTGEVTVLGGRFGRTDVRELRRRIGFVSRALFDLIPADLTAHGVVALGAVAKLALLRDRPSTEDVERARSLLAQVGCSHRLRTPFVLLSAGEQQRVCIARSLMADPDLLLLDEPTAGLDIGGREQLLEILDTIAGDHAPSIVLVTHHVEEVPRSFTHALLLREGQVEAAGAAEDVLTDATLSRTFGLPLEVHEVGGRRAVTAVAADAARTFPDRAGG